MGTRKGTVLLLHPLILYFSVYLLRFLISSVFLFSSTAIKSILGDWSGSSSFLLDTKWLWTLRVFFLYRRNYSHFDGNEIFHFFPYSWKKSIPKLRSDKLRKPIIYSDSSFKWLFQNPFYRLPQLSSMGLLRQRRTGSHFLFEKSGPFIKSNWRPPSMYSFLFSRS